MLTLKIIIFPFNGIKKIMIKGKKFDATNLPKLLNQQNSNNKF